MLIASNTKNSQPLVARARAAGETVFVETDDNAALRRLTLVAQSLEPTSPDESRPLCYLLLADATKLWLLQTAGLPDEVSLRVEVLAFTIEDLIAKTLFVGLPGPEARFVPLDRTPISRLSDSVAHLVVLGATALAEALAVNAALVAHYPNYCRDTRLRTRVTIVDDDVFAFRDNMTRRYAALFDNSYHRSINLADDDPQVIVHRPRYEGRRKDFVDVEWEFVAGNLNSAALRRKLDEWSRGSGRQLTVALCHDDDDRNLTEAVSMPEAVYSRGVTLCCRLDDDVALRLACGDSKYAAIRPFSSDICSLDTLNTLRRLAKRVNYVYDHCFNLAPGEPVTAPADIDTERADRLWNQLTSMPKRYSNIFNAMTLATKMHSLGHERGDRDEFYALSRDEIQLMTEVEHNRWSVEELILGYRPVTDSEQALVEEDITQKRKLRERKVHYDLRAFDDLRADATGKNVNIYDMALVQAIPLIMMNR